MRLLPASPGYSRFPREKELAASYLRHGFYLSFGEKYQPQALVSTPSDRLLLETDTAPVSVLQLAEKAASLRGISGRELLHEITENTNRLFFSRYWLFR